MRGISIFSFLSGFFLLFIGVSAMGAGIIARNVADLPDGFSWTAPQDLLDPRALAPATVLIALTGVDSAQALNASLDRGHWENAFAILAYDPTLSDAARVGALLQLGERFSKQRQATKAAWAYVAATRWATLSPALSDSARIDTDLQSANGLRAINARDAARIAVDQAYLIAQYSPGLRADLRAQRLAQIADAYDALGSNALATQAREKSNAAFDSPALSPRTFFSPRIGLLPGSTELESAIKARLVAAQALTAELENGATGEWSPDLVAALADALQNEDATRKKYFDAEIGQTQELTVQYALWREKLYWLALKLRVARGAFGAPLVSEWTRDVKVIGEEWSDAWAQLFILSERDARGATDANRAREDVLRMELLAVRWGWLTRAAENDVRAALAENSRAAAATFLRVERIARGDRVLDVLVPNELYGAGENALPK
ncbi:MAG: hypothetical protein HY257_03240 [Chloroflexi bacterium]|nr:hypothetical protein [Chloroflexota bacterium]